MHRLAIFASGSGTNAQRIAEYFRDHPRIRVDLILSNNPGAFVLERAQKLHIPHVVFSRQEFYGTDYVLDLLTVQNVSYLILAGFLWLVPVNILQHFAGRIVNIHPALLPRYGGKGMYGMKVHQAVLDSGDRESGITIHHVNERYDEGSVIFQARCPVMPRDTAETLAGRIHQLEYRHFPVVIEQLVLGKRTEGDTPA
jgi:phosphoribosylglycinamide formyltransferase-1